MCQSNRNCLHKCCIIGGKREKRKEIAKHTSHKLQKMGTKNNPLSNLQKDAVEVWHQQNLLLEKNSQSCSVNC